MKTKNYFCIQLILIILIFSFFSCSARQDLSLDLSGGGTGRMEITLHPVLVEYLTDLSMVMSRNPDPESLPLFDEAGIRAAFEGNPGVELLSLSIPRRNTLILDLRFTDFNAPFKNLPGARRNLISYKTQGGRGIFDFYLSGDNFFQAAAYFPLMDENLMAYFGPNPGNPVSEVQYMSDLEMAFEDYLEGEPIGKVMEKSRVSLHIRIKGEVLSVSGGRREPGGVVFETPLIRFLTLNSPIEYHLEFK